MLSVTAPVVDGSDVFSCCQYELGKDRLVGWRSSLDDASSDVVTYGLPGIASNKDGDIAVVYGRSSPKMFMETRFSTWLHNEVDIRPSRELQGRSTHTCTPVGLRGRVQVNSLGCGRSVARSF